MTFPRVSVVICTYNRADLARNAITSVLQQGVSHEEYELLIVDNASTDHTYEMSQEFCDKYSNVRYMFEHNVGLSYARNLGWREARGEYIAYLDDDGLARSGWLSAALNVIEERHPPAFGGPFYAFYMTAKPYWYKDEYESSVLSSFPRPYKENEYPNGGNLFILRELLERAGGFDSSFGMSGNKLGYAEETHLLKKLKDQDPDCVFYYDPAVSIDHLVRPEKMTLRWKSVSVFAGAKAYYRIMPRGYGIRKIYLFHALLKKICSFVKDITWGILTRDKKKYPFYQNYWYEHIIAHYISEFAFYWVILFTNKRTLT
jgi:glycosyltransferase involved in cell wall biosynthesis